MIEKQKRQWQDNGKTMKIDMTQKKILATCSVLKTISWAYKIKDLDRKTMIQSFYGRKLFIGLIINLSYNPERDSHIRDKVKVELDLSNYTTKKN